MTKYQIKISLPTKLALIVVIVFIGIFVAFREYGFKDPGYKTRLNYVPPDIKALFRENKLKDLSVYGTDRTNTPNPIAILFYQNRRYYINVVKMETQNDISLNQMISLSNNNELNTNGQVYSVCSGPYDIYLKFGTHQPSYMRVAFIGNKIDTIANNKHILAFYSEFNTFFINYDKSDTAAVWAKSELMQNTPTAPVPIELAFVKESGILYMVILTPGIDNKALNIPENTLVNLLKQPDLN